MNTKKVLILAVLAMSLTHLSVTQVQGMEARVKQNNKLQGQPAPDFVLPDTKGGKYQLSTGRNGKSVILFFWATWCPHCRTQIKELQANKAKIEAKGIQMLPINLGENKRQIENYLSQNGVTLRMLMDENNQVGDLYDVLGLPTFVFINQQGNVSGFSHHLPENLDDVF